MAVDHAQLTELFTKAIDLPPSEQAAVIARVRTDDPALAAELASLLAQDDSIVTALRTAGLKPDDLIVPLPRDAADRGRSREGEPVPRTRLQRQALARR